MVVPAVVVKSMRPEIAQGREYARSHLIPGQPATVRGNAERTQAKAGRGGTADVISRTGAVVFGPVHHDTGMFIGLLPKVTYATFSVIFEELALVRLERRGRFNG